LSTFLGSDFQNLNCIKPELSEKIAFILNDLLVYVNPVRTSIIRTSTATQKPFSFAQYVQGNFGHCILSCHQENWRVIFLLDQSYGVRQAYLPEVCWKLTSEL
jgi:hypothetical protein